MARVSTERHSRAQPMTHEPTPHWASTLAARTGTLAAGDGAAVTGSSSSAVGRRLFESLGLWLKTRAAAGFC